MILNEKPEVKEDQRLVKVDSALDKEGDYPSWEFTYYFDDKEGERITASVVVRTDIKVEAINEAYTLLTTIQEEMFQETVEWALASTEEGDDDEDK